MFRLHSRLAAAGLAVAIGLSALSARGADFATIDFPIGVRKKTPAGLSAPPRQVSTPEGIGYTELLLRPAQRGEQVFLTFVFEEDGKQVLGVFWRGDTSGEQITLAKNLSEGVKGLNRRTILLPAEAASEPGRIYVTGRQDRLVRIRIDWCEPVTTFVASDQERPALVAGGAAVMERDLGADERLSPPDAWFGEVLDASLQDGVAAMVQPVEFVVPLGGPAESARFRTRFLGLPLGRGVKVWINGQFAGRLMPDVPSLTDPGYVRRNGRTIYAGWREAGMFIEPGVLREGDNSIILEVTDPGVFVRGAAIEIEVPAPVEAPMEEDSRPELPDSAIEP